jgi:hypothetical protein
MKQAIFAGLIVDEYDNAVDVKYVGSEPCYVVNDDGFFRHIESEQVDRQVLAELKLFIHDHKDLIIQQMAQTLGQADLFTVAVLQNQIDHLDKQFEEMLQTGIPEEGRAYMGMMGFKIVIDRHGQVLKIEQPGSAPGTGDED